MRIIQPAVANRITFATLARKAGLRRHSSVTYYVPDDFEVPARLLVGAQIDGKPYAAPTVTKPKRTRKPKAEPKPEPVVEPEVVAEAEPEAEVEHSEPERWQPRSQQPVTDEPEED